MAARVRISNYRGWGSRKIRKAWGLASCGSLVRRVYLLMEQRFLKRTRALTLPSTVKVNTGYLCNLRCPHCPTGMMNAGHSPEGEIPRTSLTLDRARAIAAGLGGVHRIALFGWGEPFLNRDIFDVIEFLKDLGKRIHIDSNLSFSSESLLHHIERAPIDVLSVSLDGADQESYGTYRVRGNFAAVIANMKRLAHAPDGPRRVEWQYIVSRKNVGQVARARRMAQTIGVPFRAFDIGLYQDHFYNFTESERREWWTDDQEAAFARRNAASRSSVCSYMYDDPFIDIDGKVYPCCHAPHAPAHLLQNGFSNVFGNLATQTLREIWNNGYYQHMRDRFAGRAPTCHELKPICLQCRVYLAAQGEPQDALPMFIRSHMQAGGSRPSFSKAPERRTPNVNAIVGEGEPCL